jgi:peptidoglycan LD-endopeptidase LytH
VRAGDTVSSIASRYELSQAQLVAANGITDGIVYIGQRLRLVPVGQASSTGGEIVCPVQGGVSFVNDWGLPRSEGRSHAGTDLFAPRGRPAVATVGGTAIQAEGRRGGRQVKLVGNDGVTYYYTHLDRFGTWGRVDAGAVIGYVGNTGNAAGTSTHVHFEQHPGGGAAVNPYPALVAAC